MLKKLNSLSMLLFLVLLCLSVGQLGSFFATEHSYYWYHFLNKPSFTPPNFIFPLIWNFSYLLMAFAAWIIWKNQKFGYARAIVFWSIQLIFNALWTPLFFGQQEILYSLIIIDILWLFIFITMLLFFKQSKPAGFLMLIYLLWISFAGLLNFMIWRMNA